jgi:glycosyltransferase involved in cell wall biosynthesis
MEKKPTSDLRVGYLGQIAELKGVHVLIEAVRRMPDARLRVWVYGDLQRFPTYTARLKRLIASDARIELAGAYQGPEALTRVLAGLDVIVVPSLWYENSPNVILEAFAHGTPVVVSDLGGMAELVRDGDNGLRFKPGDAGSLAQRLQRLLDEPGLLPKLRADNLIKSVAQEMDELEAIYRQVVAGKPAPTVGPLVPSLTPS